MSLRLRAILFIGIVVLAAAALGVQLWRGVVLQTNVLAMLPATEHDPVAEAVVAMLSAEIGRRVVFLVSHEDLGSARAGAERFAREMRGAGGFRTLVDRLPPLDPALPLALYGRSRFGLLRDEDRARLLADAFDLRAAILQQVISPFTAPALLPLTRDPLGQLGRWLAGFDAPVAGLRLEDGYLWARDGKFARVLVVGEIEGDPYDNTVQQRVILAWERAMQKVADPGTEIWRTGTVFFAADARAVASADMNRIAICSVVGIALLMLIAFRSLRPLLLGLLSAAIGILFATLAIVSIDGEIHLITLAFGASLIGEAIDYAILAFAAHLAAGDRWTPEEEFARLRPGLAVAVATSLLAYSLLALLPFPGVSQVARFAVVGLIAAFLAVLLLLPATMTRPAHRDPVAATRWGKRIAERWSVFLAGFRGRRAPLALASVLAICMPGWLALKTNDDVRALVPRGGALAVQDAEIRRVTGLDAGTRFFLVRGEDNEQVLVRERALVRVLRDLERGGALAGHHAVTDFVPPAALQESDRALVGHRVFSDADALRGVLAELGFAPSAAIGMAEDFAASRSVVTVRDWLASPISVPYRHLWAPAGEAVAASIVMLRGEREPAAVAQAAAELAGVTLVDKAGSVSTLLGWFRVRSIPALLVAASAIFFVLALRYGLREAPRLMIPIALGEALSVALFGFAGEPVTLFAVAGWALALGIGINYAIFFREGAERPGATAMAVLLSGSTTLLGFGLLSLSGVAALHQFGLALLTAIAAAVLLAPLGMRTATGRAA